MSHWKIGVKILCSKSWEGQNSVKAKIWGSKFYFFLVEPLVKILCSLKRGVKILYFFPVPWKRGVKTAEPTNQLHWRGAPPGAATPSCAHCVCCGSRRSAVASLSDWFSTKTMSAPGVRVDGAIDGPTVTEADVDGIMIDVETTFCSLGDMQCHCCQMLCGLGKVQETLACPNHKTPLTSDTWQGVWDLCSLGYAPW